MKTIHFNETIMITVDLYGEDEIKELHQELTDKKIIHIKTLKNKCNNRTEFIIYTSIRTIINKTIKNLTT